MTAADVLVAGAGPGGCATALSLAREGAQVLLVGP
ncbi:FAD-dependent oxidoreductase [Streptomyces sp. NPDC048527]